MSAEQITASLGVEPDTTTVRGARRADLKLPRYHSWRIECNQRGLRVDEQIEIVLSRIRHLQPKLAQLVNVVERDDLTGGSGLTVVRYFNHSDGEENNPIDNFDGNSEGTVPGPHQLLGWSLSSETISFLASVRASVEVDEYE
jgi:hypothetical protein